MAAFDLRFRLYQRKEQFMKHSTIAKTFAIAAVTALALGVTSTARADDKGCSTASLRGTFADSASGFSTAPPTLAGPLGGVLAETFDGGGGMAANGTLNVNGTPLPVTGKGTYSVNPDCTGTYAVQVSPLGITAHYFFVILGGGDEFLWICTDPGTVLTGTARKLYPGRAI
jgi:hypothetical protein